jgi:hypothetical protein
VDEAGRSRISVEDLSVAVLDEVENPGGVRHFTVAYWPGRPTTAHGQFRGAARSTTTP